MKNSFINPKTHNYNINMQHVTLYHFLQAKSKFKQTLNLKRFSKIQNLQHKHANI